MFNIRNNAAEAAENNCLVLHANQDRFTQEGNDELPALHHLPPLLYAAEGVNVASLLTCDEQVTNTPCSHVPSMNGEHVPFRVEASLSIGSWKEHNSERRRKGRKVFSIDSSLYMVFKDIWCGSRLC